MVNVQAWKTIVRPDGFCMKLISIEAIKRLGNYFQIESFNYRQLWATALIHFQAC